MQEISEVATPFWLRMLFQLGWNNTLMRNRIYRTIPVAKMKLCGEWILGERLTEERVRDTADLRKDIRFISEWHLRYVVGRQA